MSEESVFRSNEQELQRLTQEITEIKSSISAISASVGHIEKHVKRSFGVPLKPKTPSKDLPIAKKKEQSKAEATITAEQALSIFDELSSSFNRKNPQEIENKLQEMIVPNLKLMAHELGITFSTRPSKKALYEGILGRLNERAMLSININVTPSQKEKMQNNGNEST